MLAGPNRLSWENLLCQPRCRRRKRRRDRNRRPPQESLPRRADIQPRQAGTSRKIERIRGPVQHEHRVESTDAPGPAKLVVAVEPGLVETLFFECRNPLPARNSQLFNWAEADRASRAGGGACWSKPAAQSVVAEVHLWEPPSA